MDPGWDKKMHKLFLPDDSDLKMSLYCESEERKSPLLEVRL